jgi:hypothetical protein
MEKTITKPLKVKLFEAATKVLKDNKTVLTDKIEKILKRSIKQIVKRTDKQITIAPKQKGIV